MTNSLDQLKSPTKPAGTTETPSGSDVLNSLAKGELSAGAKAQVAAIEAQEKEKAALKEEGYTFYEAAAGCFNTCLPNGDAINFLAGNYHTKDKDEIAYLEYFITTGDITKV